ncbi:MAG: PAS domain S-box protein [Vicinamibacterales bacterium]|nr:PAS domain S-box protein [Vicinamibacterales bacterium]
MSPRRPKKASHLATALIEHSSDAIALVNEVGAVLYANPATAKMVGLPIADIVGANVFRWVHDEDMLSFQTNFNQSLELAGVPVKNHFRLRHSDGTWRDIESVGVNRLSDPAIRGVIINYRNVTESRRAEEALRLGEERFRQLTEQGTDIIYNCDLQGHFTFVNRTAIKLLNYSEQELIGRHFLTLIRPDYRERTGAFYERQRSQHVPSTYFELPVVAKNGTDIWIGQSVQIVESNGRPVSVQAIARDITQRLALEEQLRQAQKMEAIGRLAGGVAHDFNNVLTAILGSADLLSMQLDPKDPRWEEADAIRRAADRGAALTRRLLSFGRPRPATVTVVDLIAAVASIEPMLRRLIVDKMTITVTSPEGSILVRADESQLNQILLNLVINARDAMPDGGTAGIETGVVNLEESRARKLGVVPGPYARLTVRDTGEGIPADVIAHLFEPFFTTKPPEQGTGLGLSIVYSIVTSLGGAIDVQSDVGKGAVFTIFLPLVTSS